MLDMEQRACERCGTDYEPANGMQKYCLSCRVESKRERDRANQLKRRIAKGLLAPSLPYSPLRVFVDRYSEYQGYAEPYELEDLDCVFGKGYIQRVWEGYHLTAEHMACRVGGSSEAWTRNIHRWNKSGRISVKKADEVCCFLEMDPSSIWGEDWLPIPEDDEWYSRWLAGEVADEERIDAVEEGRTLTADRREYREQVGG